MERFARSGRLLFGMPKSAWGMGRNMHIAGRLALQSPSGIVAASCDAGSRITSDILSYHGCDVVVSGISECGFEASLGIALKKGALISLRLPGAGMLLARVTSCRKGQLKAAFVNPVAMARLRKTPGMSRLTGPQPVFA